MHIELIILNQFSEGNLFCSRNGKYFKWYQTDGTNQTYIPKDQRERAEQLAVKKYHTMVLQDMKNEYAACQAYLAKYKETRSDKLLERPGYDDLLKSYFLPMSKELKLWASEHYEKNQNYPENLIHKCASGILVRSKSEAMIASALYRRGIPFRYECVLQVQDLIVYPDFTIRHPKTGEIYYWEHFGLMDQPVYARKAGIKLQNYIASGIIPSIQLITTYETKECPLSVDLVEEIVERYFM